MTRKEYSEFLVPNVEYDVTYYENKYPARTLEDGAMVTRFAPSPTGFVHFGGLFPSTVGERLAHQSGGVFYLRIEDTDAKREVEGAAEGLIKTLAKYGVHFDEGAILDENGNISDFGAYGPYKQSLRGHIYQVYAKKLVCEGKAYPCFTTEEELNELQSANKKEEIKNTDWLAEAEARRAEMLARRNFTIDEVKAHLEEGHPFVLRILANGDPDKKIKFTDLVKGTIEIPENDEDFVLLKSDGIPTYHFAHAIDDHLMGTTHVIRGEEWLPSLAKHIQLFSYLGFRLPKYMHIAQIMRIDESGNKKKLSKRDMGANMDDYTSMGYCPEAVCEYIMTLLNSNYEEWHMQNADKPYTDFPFSIKKMSTSGCLFDFAKLNDVSKNVISRMSAEKVYELSSQWAKEFDKELYEEISANPEYTKSIFAIGRGGKNPRKDIAVWTDVRGYVSFFYDKLFKVIDSYPEKFSSYDIKAALTEFTKTFDINDDSGVWFEKIKDIADMLGFASDMKAYKLNPEAYKGNVSDISMFIRIAISGKMNAPDMYTSMQILGYDRVIKRINDMISSL